ncbi:MAG: RiPP maturation radical SAM protein 1 [Thermoanaerobaculia bacterium]|nr:RiPP maturation radical SAM protein 1 [Thermoanaerobaculia bacterium]
MPFSALNLPSIALTQLKAVAEEKFGSAVRVRILYLHHDFALYFGKELYSYVIGALQANNSGLGDWIFRQVAFPEEADNTAYYFQRYFPRLDERETALKGAMIAKRVGLKRYFESVVAKYQLDREDLVGMSSMFAQNVAVFAMARTIKDRNPRVVTVMGGANCEAPMGVELARHVAAMDFVFSGPALLSFPELVQAQLDGEPERCHQIKGVFSRQNLDSPHLAGRGAIGEELPIEVPVELDYESFLSDLTRSFPDRSIEPSITFETSRGCWWGERSHCTFCGLNGGSMAYRSIPPSQALEIFRQLFERYADRCKIFESVDNIMPRPYIKEVFGQLEPRSDVTIFYEVKADLKDWEMEILGRAGVRHIQPGIESLATSTLKLMGKGTTAFQNVVFLKNCLRYGILPSWNLLIGFPRETSEVYEGYLAAIPRLMHLPPPSGAFPIRFDRYSPYFTRAAEYGLDLVPYEFYNAIYPFGPESLARMAYYFEDKNYDAEYLVQLVGWQGKLMAAVGEWKARYAGSDGKTKASLRLSSQAGRDVVLDTRSGELEVKELSALVNEVFLPHESVARVRSEIVLETLKEPSGLPLPARR